DAELAADRQRLVAELNCRRQVALVGQRGRERRERKRRAVLLVGRPADAPRLVQQAVGPSELRVLAEALGEAHERRDARSLGPGFAIQRQRLLVPLDRPAEIALYRPDVAEIVDGHRHVVLSTELPRD